MKLHQPVWRTQWHRVNTTPACCALERISQPEDSWFFLIQKIPDVSSMAEDLKHFCPGGGNHCTRSMERGKETFWALWESLGTPQQGIYSFVSTHLIGLSTSWSNPGPSFPSPAEFVLHQWNPNVLCPKFSTAENVPGSSYHSTLKMVWWIFWGGNREWSLVHRRTHDISPLRLFRSLSQH